MKHELTIFKFAYLTTSPFDFAQHASEVKLLKVDILDQQTFLPFYLFFGGAKCDLLSPIYALYMGP